MEIFLKFVNSIYYVILVLQTFYNIQNLLSCTDISELKFPSKVFCHFHFPTLFESDDERVRDDRRHCDGSFHLHGSLARSAHQRFRKII